LAIDPNYVSALTGKGDALEDLRNYTGAIDPQYVSALNNKRLALDNLGNYTQQLVTNNKGDPCHSNTVSFSNCMTQITGLLLVFAGVSVTFRKGGQYEMKLGSIVKRNSTKFYLFPISLVSCHGEKCYQKTVRKFSLSESRSPMSSASSWKSKISQFSRILSSCMDLGITIKVRTR
jgi:hypothetical protein